MSESSPRGLSHYRADGSAHMVDVSDKAVTTRSARAVAEFRSSAEVISRIIDGDLPKGEAIATARIAGIMAAKRTHDLIPLCHPLPLSHVTLDFDPAGDTLTISSLVRTTARTGVEMEALTAATVAALTIFDMVKAVDPRAIIGSVRVDAKSGGTHDWERDD